ncbi:uncharacterized protein SCHCODRAFT_02678116 [Schizophyllum commune H4-8]|uniref:ABM domain-containing protein n=1 Tax=Schizophyllum commune (strain H4-8 / FGSC 9210) TaxID=578458 RepID=D8Q5W7_SCHCM|nr:uncharacterized protein SCHCODRAFT_02678116 [Schizophyllum commune H4-8]KAI5891996.1 hypothetical protein SCHCODRAFT_02678116 [Schizophyllum commune H4-8]
MAILECFASTGFDDSSLSEIKHAISEAGDRLQLTYAAREIENPDYVNWVFQWTSVRARDAALADGSYQRFLAAAGTVSERAPVVMSLKDSQYGVLERILDTPVPEIAVTAVKNAACREGAERAVQGMLANPHERTTQGELVLAAVDDEDCIVFICGWNSVEDHMMELAKESQKAVNDLAMENMEARYVSHCSKRMI